MYFDEPTQTAPIVRGQGVTALLALNGLAVLVFGLLPGGLMAVCRDAIIKALAS
jgi:NADH-quinone oxidoreductase subunit N